MPRNGFSIILLIVVVLAALWFLDAPPEQFQFQTETGEEKTVLVRYTDSVQTTQYDKSGMREHYFEAARVNHRITLAENSSESELGKAEITQPQVTLFNNGAPKWHIQAQFGESDLGEEKIHLSQNVVIEQQQEKDRWTINTDSMWIDTNTQEAATDAFITVMTPGLVSTGTGMKASFINEKFEVLANTETIYDTSK